MLNFDVGVEFGSTANVVTKSLYSLSLDSGCKNFSRATTRLTMVIRDLKSSLSWDWCCTRVVRDYRLDGTFSGAINDLWGWHWDSLKCSVKWTKWLVQGFVFRNRFDKTFTVS